jgi:hypothetical protein
MVYCYSDNLMPELQNTARSCRQHGRAAASLTSPRPGDVISVPEKSILLGVGVSILSVFIAALDYPANNVSACYELHR